MYQAKRLGRNNVQWYQAEMEILQNKRLSLRAMLKRAIENQEFELYYQPQVEAGSGVRSPVALAAPGVGVHWAR